MSARDGLTVSEREAAEHDEACSRNGYRRALSDIRRLRDAVEAGDTPDAKRHAKRLPGLKMACGFLERRLKETEPVTREQAQDIAS